MKASSRSLNSRATRGHGSRSQELPAMPFQRSKDNLHTKQMSTWEDVLNVGEIRKHNTRTKKAEHLEVHERQWLHIGEIERRISLNRSLKAGQRRNHEDWLVKAKQDFKNTKKRLKSEVEEILKENKETLSEELHFKFDTVIVDQLEDKRINEMRKSTYEYMTRLRIERQKPLKWFRDIESEMHSLIGRNNNNVNDHLEKLHMFCHEEPEHILQGKDKLCLLVMSIPLNTLLTQAVIDAVEFVLTQVLNGTTDLLHMWINARKLQQLSKSICIVAKNG